MNQEGQHRKVSTNSKKVLGLNNLSRDSVESLKDNKKLQTPS